MFKILKILKIFEKIINKNNILRKNHRKCSNFQKPEYLWKNSDRYICVQNFEQISWKNALVLVFWRSKPVIFTCYLEFLHFPDFQILPDFGRSKSALGLFLLLWRKPDLKTCMTPPKHKIFCLTFPWPRDLEWPWHWICHRKPRMILRSVPDTIHVVTLTYFHLIRL